MAFIFQELAAAVNGPTIFFALKEQMVAAGWTVMSSSDGITYDNAGDIITHAGTGANGLDNGRAWLRLNKSGLEMTFQRNTAGQSNNNWRIKAARSPFDSGSPDATTTPQPANIEDEVVVFGGGTDAAPSWTSFNGGASPATNRIKIAVDDATGLGFYCVGFADAAGAMTSALLLDPMLHTDEDDSFPYVIYCSSSNVFSSATMIGAVFPGFYSFQPGGGPAYVVSATNYRNSTGSTNTNIPDGLPVDPITGAYGVTGIPIFRSAGSGPGIWKGVTSLLKWNAVAAPVTGDTYSLDSPLDRIVLQDCNLLWSGVAPVNGAATTDFTAVEHDRWTDDYLLASVGGFAGGGGIFLMQAEDSVTGSLFHWTSTTTDFAGAGYPGPNSPVKIAVAAEA